jgi:hypothetical protein
MPTLLRCFDGIFDRLHVRNGGGIVCPASKRRKGHLHSLPPPPNTTWGQLDRAGENAAPDHFVHSGFRHVELASEAGARNIRRRPRGERTFLSSFPALVRG